MAARLRIFHNALRESVRNASTAHRTRVAQEMAAEVRAAAPVRSGAFRDGVSVEVAGTQVRLVDWDPTSIHKEYGTADTPAHAVFTDAAIRRGRYRGMRPKAGRRKE